MFLCFQSHGSFFQVKLSETAGEVGTEIICFEKMGTEKNRGPYDLSSIRGQWGWNKLHCLLPQILIRSQSEVNERSHGFQLDRKKANSIGLETIAQVIFLRRSE